MKEICYFIVDFKFHNEQLVPLELGEALVSSAYEGYDNLSDVSMGQRIFKHLATQSESIYLATPSPRSFSEQLRFFDDTMTASESLEMLHPQFQGKSTEISSVNQVTRSEKAILVAHLGAKPAHTFERSVELRLLLKAALKENLVINSHDSFLASTRDKRVFAAFLQKSGVEAQPKTWLIRPEHFLTDVPTTDFQADKNYIFKIPDGTKGEGSFIVSGDQVLLMLAAIKNKDPAALQKIHHEKSPLFDNALNYWLQPKADNHYLLIQEYIPSDPIQVMGKSYDATGRVVVAAVKDDEKLDLSIVDGYWKLPRTPMQATVTIASGISHIEYIQNAPSSVLLSNEEKQKIQMQLSSKLVNCILNTQLKDMIAEILLDGSTKDRHYFLQKLSNEPIAMDAAFIRVFDEQYKNDLDNRKYYLEFMVNQAKSFYFGSHLQLRNHLVADWLLPNVSLLTATQRLDLTKHIRNVVDNTKQLYEPDLDFISYSEQFAASLVSYNAQEYLTSPQLGTSFFGGRKVPTEPSVSTAHNICP